MIRRESFLRYIYYMPDRLFMDHLLFIAVQDWYVGFGRVRFAYFGSLTPTFPCMKSFNYFRALVMSALARDVVFAGVVPVG
jgi:hypothetical protein